MENRFFDIDSNIYLNALYLVLLMHGDSDSYNLDDLNVKLFLMKNTYLLLHLSKLFDMAIPDDLLEEFQYLNLQADMSKYSLKVQVKGLMETLNFLYSKGLVEVDYTKSTVKVTRECKEMNINEMPEKISNMAGFINRLFSEVGIKSIKKKLFLGGDNLYE